MSKVLEGLKYAESHEWVKVEGDIAVIGISDFAQHSMGDLSYVDMPSVGDDVAAGEEFGAVESVKAASDLISPEPSSRLMRLLKMSRNCSTKIRMQTGLSRCR